MSRRRWWLIGGGTAVVIAAVAGVLIWQAASRPATAEEAATAYLRALESGDAAAVEATGIPVASTALDAFADAAELIEDAEVSAVDENDDGSTTADVAFNLGGEERTAQLTLSNDDGRWTVDSSALGTTTATATIGAFVGIGDATFPVGEGVGLLPAGYTVSAAPASLLDGESTVLVLPGEPADVALEVALRPEATDAAQKQLDAHLDACTAPAKATPEGCGIRIPWGTEFRAVTEMRFRIEQAPVVTLTATGFSADGGVLVATVTGTGQDGAERTTTYRTDSWSVRGDIAFTADGLELTAW
ncbi:hypothetical protein [Microbacterium sp. EST19A]|uniref:hypothetical protein n=1 Tax=Microbacterium sp. EST19A TaxID=2862681 RepID=UPI001CBB30C7|nr:hypothetical protein [Microbacterium sp. EST19A]